VKQVGPAIFAAIALPLLMSPGLAACSPEADSDAQMKREIFSADSGQSDTVDTTNDGEDDLLMVTGVLTNEGVECQMLRGDDGRFYALLGDIGGARSGDRLRVTGRVAEMSICMQGTALAVETVEHF
jgi:hypothetical protein